MTYVLFSFGRVDIVVQITTENLPYFAFNFGTADSYFFAAWGHWRQQMYLNEKEGVVDGKKCIFKMPSFNILFNLLLLFILCWGIDHSIIVFFLIYSISFNSE